MIFDLVIVILALPLAVIGYRRGLVVAAITVAGFAAGASSGAWLAHELVAEDPELYAPAAAMVGALVLGTIAAITAEQIAAALRLPSSPRRARALNAIDRAAGAAALVGLVLAQAWVLGAVAINTPGLERVEAAATRSKILTGLYAAFPARGPLFKVLLSVEPRELRVAPVSVGPIDPAIAFGGGLRGVRQSVVMVLAPACGIELQGSGWVPAAGMVVTTAHVVAGADEVTLDVVDGGRLDAVPIRYRPGPDLAILRAEELDAPALELAGERPVGAAAATVGYPEGTSFTALPARLGETKRVVSETLYGRGPTRQRTITTFRGEVRRGSSGGPVVDGSGRVLTTVFGTASGEDPPTGLGVPNELVSRELRRANGAEPTGTGACAWNR